MHTNQTGKMRKHIMMFVSTKINKKTTKLILLCIWVLKQMQEKLLLDHSNDRDRERTKKEEGNRKSTVVGIDIGVSPRVDMIPRFKNLPLDLIRKQSHFALIFLALLCSATVYIKFVWKNQQKN